MQELVVAPRAPRSSPSSLPPCTGQVFQRFTSDVSDRPTSVGCANGARLAGRSSGVSSSGDGGGCFPASLMQRTFGEIGRQAVWPRVRSHHERPGDRRRKDVAREQELLSCDRLRTRKCTSGRTIPPPPTTLQLTSPPHSAPPSPKSKTREGYMPYGGWA